MPFHFSNDNQPLADIEWHVVQNKNDNETLANIEWHAVQNKTAIKHWLILNDMLCKILLAVILFNCSKMKVISIINDYSLRLKTSHTSTWQSLHAGHLNQAHILIRYTKFFLQPKWPEYSQKTIWNERNAKHPLYASSRP